MGAGDLKSLAEKTSMMDEKRARHITKKIKKGQFNFNDFLEQMESIKKLGSMKSIISMIPGMSGMEKQMKDMDLENSSRIKQIEALISSMTHKERENPDLLNNSRKKRIAKGAGLSQIQVNRLLKQFKKISKLGKQLSKKGGARKLQDMMKQMGGQGMSRPF